MVDLDSASLIVIISIGAGVLGLIIRYSYKSKCDRIEVCDGYCIRIHRAVETEQLEPMEQNSSRNNTVNI